MTLLAPFLLPLLAALASLFLRGRALLALNLTASLGLLSAALALLLQVAGEGAVTLSLGSWPLPFGIALAADALSALLVVMIALVAAVVFLFQSGWQESPPGPVLYPLLHGLVAASIAVGLAADLFNLYVWFELLLVAVLGLLALGGRRRHREAAFKYLVVSLLGTLMMLAAIGLIQGATGHLNFAALRDAAQAPGGAPTLYLGLLLAALLLKLGAFPLFSWLPAAYHTLPAPVLALVGGLLTKLAAYVLLRLTGQVFDAGPVLEMLGWLAVVTMLSGVLGAAYHWDLRRILAFHIVSQVGFLLLGVALATPAAATGTAFFLFHNMLVKAHLFLLAGLVWWTAGHYDLRRIGGLSRSQPLLAGLFLLSALSLVGIPPSTGFWGKFLLLRETLLQGRYLWAALAMTAGLLTLYSMSKIWLEAFWKPHPGAPEARPAPPSATIAVAALGLVIAWLGVAPDPLIAMLQDGLAGFGAARG